MKRWKTEQYWLWASMVTLAIVGLPHVCVAEEPAASPDAETLVELACAAEVSDQPALKDSLLEKALSRDPDCEKARWLTASLRSEQGWVPAFPQATSAVGDETLNEYHRRRDACGEDASSRLLLANWCRDHGMPDREKVHLREIVAWHGGDTAIMRRLGMRQYRGQWVPEDQIEALRECDERQRRAEAKWKRVLSDWKTDLREGLKQDEAAAYARLAGRLKGVTDDEAILVLEEAHSTEDEKLALAVVAHLDEVRTQAATESLVRHAVFSEFDAVRTAACSALKKRPRYNYVPILLSGMIDPLEIEVEYPYGNRGYRRTTSLQRGAEYDVKKVSHQSRYITNKAGVLDLRKGFFRDHSRSVTGLPDRVMPGQYAEMGTEKTRRNSRIAEALYRLTGESYRSPEEWRDWWYDYSEYERGGEKPVYTRDFHSHQWQYSFSLRTIRPISWPTSCLAWGTPVATETGMKRIEQIVPGDRVLAQDPETGELDYKVVLQRTVRRLGEMRKISVGDDSVTVTLGHPFWVVGEGWRMAKQLGAGQRLHCLEGAREIRAIEKLPEDVAYNLVVDDFATYFAGTSLALLHDNTLPKPTDALLPGYAPVRRAP